jgi:hypothetical protein
MDVAANALFATGLLVFLFGYLAGVVVAFGDGAVLGLVCLFVPAVLIYHLSTRLSQGRLPLILIHSGMALSVLGLGLASTVYCETIGDR